MLTATLEPTSLIVHINGVPCCVWQGKTHTGLSIHAHIALVGCDRDADAPELEAALREVAAPRPELTVYDGRKLRVGP